ncbi:lipid kinase [[Phormidium ambiguum] IAM M-71]|uniref:Methylglyoxal synthase n=1 Tax=[Phormidium ambiguum] IAM M-71 TaxID=454136 RepID=A0A1U7IRK5_9CYAN|nr:methylglyoxal synthase [Phormidium ambiguum]OKH40002.1 lipid kinase [Phormidium ambiguum IAM M-71]
MTATIALIAHDAKKDDIVNFARKHAPVLGRYRLIATANTGQRITAETGLVVEQLAPGMMRGDVQIAAEVVAGNMIAVIFLVEPFYVQPVEPNVQTILQVCQVHNVAIATNLSTAEAIVTSLAKTLVAHLIYNPVAGQGNAEQELTLIRELLEPHLNLHIHFTEPEIDPATLATQAIAAQADMVIASGGDGTVSAIAGALIGSGIPLGIIPRGTANAFAVSLGIPRLLPIRNACQIILANNTRTVDAAKCNGLPMILLAGVGYEAGTVERASRELKDRWGAMAYLMAGWQLLDESMLFDTQIETEEGKIYDFQATAITIANAAPPTSVLAQGAGQVIFDDGLLDVTIATADNKLEAVSAMLRMFGAAITRTEFEHKNVIHGRAKWLKLTTNPPQKVVLDGEIIGTTPIEVECIPDGLTVLAPKV